MYEIVFTLRSETDARQGQALCRRHGITAAVVRASGERGCGYGLRVPEEDAPVAAVLLQQAGIPNGREGAR